MVKGIILAGGSGTRLHPVTRGVSKQLLPVHNKPMVYYPLSALIFSEIRDVLLITTPHDLPCYKMLLGDGSQLGMNISYAIQPQPEGLAQAFIIGREFIGSDRVALALGDNIFFGHGLPKQFRQAARREKGATVFGYMVQDPERYGVVEFERDGKTPKGIVEKPEVAPSNYAVTGLYFYDNQVVDIAANLKPSPRGELEITDVNKAYLDRGELQVTRLGRGVAWLDTGTHHSLLQASNFVQVIEERQGLMVGCVEEIAFRMGFIDVDQLDKLAYELRNNSYGEYLQRFVDEARESDDLLEEV